jgi:hypothetical protein
MQEGTCRFDYRVHAFCPMTNHIHLALQAGAIPLSRGKIGTLPHFEVRVFQPHPLRFTLLIVGFFKISGSSFC